MSRRVLAATLYLGIAPFFVCARRFRAQPFLLHHYKQAMGLILLGLLFLLLTILLVAGISFMMVYFRPAYDAFHPEALLRSFMRKLFIVWATITVFSIVLALLGSCRPVLFIHRLGAWKRLVTMAAVSAWALYAMGGMGVLLAWRADRMVRDDPRPGEAYLLFEDNDLFPRPLLSLGFYRVSAAARQKWGEDSVVMLKLSEESLRRALREGRFVFIGSHGTAQGIIMKEGFIEPEQVQEMQKNPVLQFVYLAGCDSGAKRTTWETAFYPAAVVTYDRLTAVLEHIWWLWMRGPEIVRQLD